jgi:Ca2+:H+ antiporter
MAVASASLIIPAALNMTYAQNSTEEAQSSILTLSRGASIVLLILYAIYLNFQLRTHSSFFEEEETPVEKDRVDGLKQLKKAEVRAERILTPPAALATLFLISMTIALCAEFLVGTIDDIVQIYGVNRTFIGLIILPIVGNAAEHISAVIAASKNKMDLALGVALGSSLQIALLVTPALVLLGWVVGQPMSLSFEPFGAGVFFLSVIVVTGLIQDGDSNYLEGAMLVGM